MDIKSKFINTYVVTSASVHDSKTTDDLLNENDEGQEFYADIAYTGENQEETIAKHKMINKFHEK
ncbi:MAG: IS5 family transposase [Glaciecola sp.]|jgi:IS5 family transposase